MFKSHTPVTGISFFNREEALARLHGLVKSLEAGAPSWMAILGSRKIGKTSLILELARRCRADDLRFVVIDSYEHLPMSWEIFRRFALRVVDAFFAREVEVSLERLVRDRQRYRGALQRSATFSSLDAELRTELLELATRPADAFLAEFALELPEQLASATATHVVVAWDEFQELRALASGRGGRDPFALMRSRWQHHQQVGYIISGSARSMLQHLLLSVDAPFFQHFSIMDLGPFDAETARQLLRKLAPRQRNLPQAQASRVAALLDGHPFYLQLFGEELVQREPPYGDEDVKETFQSLLFSRTGRLALYFEQRFRSAVGRSSYLASVLTALAEGPQRLTEISTSIRASTGSTVRYLERLPDLIVRQDDGRYRLDDPVFGLWLRWRQPGGTVVPMTVLGDEAERDVAMALSIMGFDLVYQSRASRGAFDLLATRGDRQLGIQVKRAPLPLRFKKSAWNRMEAESRRLGWHWIVAAAPPDAAPDMIWLDPEKSRRAREVRLDADAAIDNLLAWLDEAPNLR